jgi:hypothetical protein
MDSSPNAGREPATCGGCWLSRLGNASAAYACNGNVCWVVKETYTYPAESKVIVREESWKPGPEITIREPREGRGYYVGSEWRTWQ